MLTLQMNPLEELLRSFYAVTKVRIGIFTPDGHEQLAYPAASCQFCGQLRRNCDFDKQCSACDHTAFSRAMTAKTPYIYRCHAGLYEAAVPILYKDIPLACIMLGQVVPADIAAVYGQIAAYIAPYDPDKALLCALKELPSRTEEEIQACVQLMSACASHIYRNSLVAPAEDQVSAKLRAYLNAVYPNKISLTDMASAMGMCVTSLCTLVRQQTNLSPHEMLTQIRIEKAKHLLAMGKTIRDTAAAVGLPDYNYFARIFKKHTGSTPSAYARLSRTP